MAYSELLDSDLEIRNSGLATRISWMDEEASDNNNNNQKGTHIVCNILDMSEWSGKEQVKHTTNRVLGIMTQFNSYANWRLIYSDVMSFVCFPNGGGKTKKHSADDT